MVETSAVGFGLAEIFLLLFSGQFLGLVPGERDPALIKSPPANVYFYQEWTSPGAIQPGGVGIAGLLADQEIQTLLDQVASSLAEAQDEDDGPLGSMESTTRADLLTLLRLTATHAGCLYVSGDVPAGKPSLSLPLEGALVLNLRDDTDEFLSVANRLLQRIDGYEPTNQPHDHPIPLNRATARLHREGSTIIVAVGQEALPRLLHRRGNAEAQLPKVSAFATAWNHAKPAQIGRLSWINLQAVRAELPARFGIVGTMVCSVADALGVSQVSSLLTTSSLDGPDSVVQTHMAVEQNPAGLLKLLGGRGLNAADFASIPADADFVAAVSLDLSRLRDTAREIVMQTLPDAVAGFDEFQRQLELELKLDSEDIIAAFGDVVTAYDSPSSGGLGLTGLVIALPVKDAGRAANVVQSVHRLIVEGLPPSMDDSQVSLVDIEFQGHTIHYLDSRGYSVRYNSEPPWSPAICLTEQSLLIALHPQAIKAHLRFIASTEPRLSELATRKLIPQNGALVATLMLDTPRIAATFYSVLPYLLKPTLAEHQAEGGRLKLGDIPSARAVLPYLQPATLTVVRRNTEVLIEQRNLLPLLAAVPLLKHILPSADGHFGDEGEMPLEGRRNAPGGAPVVNLGAGTDDGVQPAKAEQLAPPPKELTAVERAAIKALPVMIQGTIPAEIEQFIPDIVFQKIAEEADPERVEQRRLEREQRRIDRAARRAARRGVAP